MQPKKKITRKGRERKPSGVRAARYTTWKALHAAVLGLCWAHVEDALGGRVDRVAAIDLIRDRFKDLNDDARRIEREVFDALAKAVEYLDANPQEPTRNAHARTLKDLVSFRCVHDVNAPVTGGDPKEENRSRGSIRGMIDCVRRLDAPGPEDWSRRTRIVVQTSALGGHAWWWRDRKPLLRDLAVLSLLAGNIPEGAKRRQDGAIRAADRPTVLDVVADEEKGLRTAMGRHRRPRQKRAR